MRRALNYWESAAERGEKSGLNNLAVCLMYGTNGMEVDLPRARDLFRQSAELFSNEAMINLADLHASLHEYETATRWADTAFAFGFVPAAEKAQKYRKMAHAWKDLPSDVTDTIAKFPSMTLVKPSPSRTNRVLSVEELRAIDTPYCKRLLSAREKMIEACSFDDSDLEIMVKIVRLAADAYRMEDGMIVFTEEEKCTALVAANALVEAGVEVTPDLALCSGGTDPASFVTYWRSMQMKFPDDLTITRRAACAFMFFGYAGADKELGVRLFGRALSLLQRPDDDSDPATMGLLYEAGAAYFQINENSLAQKFLTRFLKHAVVDGHRKAPEAHFMLGIMILLQALPNGVASESLREKNSLLERLSADAREHLQEGIVLQGRLPNFLQAGHESQQRKSLERLLRATSLVTSPATTLPPEATECGVKRGGEMISGPRRHPKLRSDKSMLSTSWRKSIAKFAELRGSMDANMCRVSSSVVPPRSSTDCVSPKSAVPATIDELFSALKDRVYKGRSIECLVVSTPIFTGSSFQMIVEDSQREPARLAVYNATPSLVGQLVPGRALVVLNPYVRIASDASIRLRVDNPNDTIQLKHKHSICWMCSMEEQSDHRLKSCAKCHKAFYCNKKCQKQDWMVYGHRYLCSSFTIAP